MKFKEAKVINVLGTEYKLVFMDEVVDEEIGNLNGLCDLETLEIQIDETLSDKLQKLALRHEILHAFLYECGLDENSLITHQGWAVNEEMVDFFAIQWPKINKIYEELDLI